MDLPKSNLYSLAEAKVFDYLEARAIYSGEHLIGFMLYYFQPFGLVRKMGPEEGEHGIDSGGMDYVYFKRIMIDEKWQGEGLGKAAMKKALHFFKEEYSSIGFIELMHYFDNDTGASFYEALGFTSTGEIRRTIRPGTEDEIEEELVHRKDY